MADRKVNLVIEATASGAERARQTLVSGFAKAAQDINRSFNSINKLDGLRSSISATHAQLDTVRRDLRAISEEMQRGGADKAGLNALKAQYRALQVELNGLERSLARDVGAAQKLEESLRAVGISSTGIGAARAQIDQMTQSLQRAQAEINGIRRNAQNLFGGIGDVGRSQAPIQAEIAALRQRNALIGARTELERLERGIVLGNYAAYTSAQLAQLRQLALEYDAKQALLRVERERLALSAAQRGAVGNFAQGALSVGGFGFGLGAVGGGIAAATGVVFSSQQALELERANAALGAVNGNLEIAGKEMDFVRKQAERLGVSVTDMSRSWVQLSAASKGSALEGEGARQVFLAITEAAQRLNLRSFETEGALRAVGQMMSKGTVQSEELRGQLGDRLPGAFNIMARALGVTTAELGEMLKAGEVLSADALPKFATELRKTFGTDVNTRINTTVSNFTRLANEIKLAAAEMGGLINAVAGPGAGKLAEIIRTMRESDVSALANIGGGAAIGAVAAGPYGGLAGAGVGAVNYGVKLRREQETRALQDFLSANIYGPTGGFRFDVPGLPGGKPSSLNDARGLDLLARPGGPEDVEELEKVQKEIALLGVKSEVAKTLWEIEKGSLRTASEARKQAELQLAAKKDLIAADKTGAKRDKQDDKSLADSTKAFLEAVEAESKILEQQAKFKRQLNIETLEAQGLDTQAALAKVRDQYADFTKDLAGSAEGLDLANKWFNAAESKIALDGIQSQVRKLLETAQAGVQANDLRAASASPSERDRLNDESMAIVERARAQIAALKDNAAIFGGASSATFTSAIDGATASIDNMAESLRRATEGPFKQMFRDWSEGTLNMERAAASWLGSTVDGIAEMVVKGKSDFRSLGESIIQDIIRIQLQATIAGLAGGGGGAGLTQTVGGFFTRLFSPSTSATGVVTRADGGMVFGPGTSRSDSIPAMLSNGEFVINAKAVRTFGRDLFEGLNRGFRPTAVRRYADGGYVGPGVGGGGGASGGNYVQVINATGQPSKTETVKQGGIEYKRIIIGTLKDDVAQNGEFARFLQRSYGLSPRPDRR